MRRPNRLPKARLAALAVLCLFALLAVGLSRPAEPAPLPAGATPLQLHAQPAEWHVPWELLSSCGAATLAPVAPEVDGDRLVFRGVADAAPVDIIWPPAFSARLWNGTAEVVTPAGQVVARQGQPLTNLAGSTSKTGAFAVCYGTPLEPLPAQ